MTYVEVADMARLLTVHEFVDTCNRECLVHKHRCTRYRTVREYLTHLELRFETRKDVVACEVVPRSKGQRFQA